MNVLHVCLANFYVDNYGYQENIITKTHKSLGYNVKIIASTETFIDNRVLGFVSPGRYINENGIEVVRIPYKKTIPHILAKKLRKYEVYEEELISFKPDVIFAHGVQFDSRPLRNYLDKHTDVNFFMDSHTDLVNSARSFISNFFLHGILYKYYVKKSYPYAKKIFGTLPVRVSFLQEMYNLPSGKLEVLNLGADDNEFDLSMKKSIRKEIRNHFGIKETDTVLISGGKIELEKNIHLIIQALIEIGRTDIKLLLFGNPSYNMEAIITKQINECSSVINLGWLKPEEMYRYFFAADLGFYPGTHSVLWEQSIGVKLPSVFFRWKGLEHLDLGGNCIFIDQKVTVSVLKNIILSYTVDSEKYILLKQKCEELDTTPFLYSQIAKKSIGL